MIRMIKNLIFILIVNILCSQSFSDIMNEKPLWTGSFGTVSIDGETYNQVSLRPEFNLGKWGMGFDFYLYINGNGEIPHVPARSEPSNECCYNKWEA